MEANILTQLFLPLALGIIMLGMGLALTVDDFKRVALFPKATFIGLFSQLILLPVVAFFALKVVNLPAEMAVGVMLLAFCPGGPTSNLISNLAKADVALSITLTAIASVITVFTIPFLINLSMEHFLGEGKFIKLPVLETMLQIIVITIIPVSIGMVLNKKFPATALKSVKPVKIASAVFIAIIILGVVIKERENIVRHFATVGATMLLINAVIMVLGYYIARFLALGHEQRASISIEGGIQNGTLAIAIATSSLLLNNSEMSIAPAVYSLIMFGTGALAAWVFTRPKVIGVRA